MNWTCNSNLAAHKGEEGARQFAHHQEACEAKGRGQTNESADADADADADAPDCGQDVSRCERDEMRTVAISHVTKFHLVPLSSPDEGCMCMNTLLMCMSTQVLMSTHDPATN